MWAVVPVPVPVPVPVQPLKTWPRNSISTTKPPPYPCRHGGFWKAPPPLITALKYSNEPANKRTKSPPPPPPAAEKQESEQLSLSGADVLIALQRATARKKEKRDVSTTGNNAAKENEGQTPSVSVSVRPFSIQPEWTQRLEQLQIRLEHLSHTSA